MGAVINGVIMSNSELILIDLDGTLINTLPDLAHGV